MSTRLFKFKEVHSRDSYGADQAKQVVAFKAIQAQPTRQSKSRLATDRFRRDQCIMSTGTDSIILEIPREIPHVTKLTPEELKQELAFTLFAQGKVSLGKARELAGLTVWQFQNELGRRGIPAHYGARDFAEHVATLRELGRL